MEASLSLSPYKDAISSVLNISIFCILLHNTQKSYHGLHAVPLHAICFQITFKAVGGPA